MFLDISVMCHCEGRGLSAIVGHKSHILINEQGGMSQVRIFYSGYVREENNSTLSKSRGFSALL